MKLCFLTGSRGEWGYIRPILALARARGHEIHIVATNQHLSAEHGKTAAEIIADGFTIACELPCVISRPPANAIGDVLCELSYYLSKHTPDWLVLAGDRGEQLAGAIAGAYAYIPTAHIQAGERSGNIDGAARHAIAKLAHLHFASNPDAVGRLIRSGEDPWRVHMVGAPQIDDIKPGSPRPIAEPYLLVILHPTTEEASSARAQTSAVVSAVSRTGMRAIWLTPNSDPGSEPIRDVIPESAIINMPRGEYLSCLEHAAAIVGNSSSGLLEAPYFGTPCVNIGRRQIDRVRGPNVIDVTTFDAYTILQAINDAVAMPRTVSQPYGDGKSTPRILDILTSTHKTTELVAKRMTY